MGEAKQSRPNSGRPKPAPHVEPAVIDRVTAGLVALVTPPEPDPEPSVGDAPDAQAVEVPPPVVVEVVVDPPAPHVDPPAPHVDPLAAVLACPHNALHVYRAVAEGRILIATWARADGRIEARTPTGAVVAEIYPVDPAHDHYGVRVGSTVLVDGPLAGTKPRAEALLVARGYAVLA